MGACESAQAKGPARAGPLRHYTSPRNSLAVQAAEQPDQQNDRQWNADEPKQYPASHDILLCCLIKDCLSTTPRGGSSIVAAGIGCGLELAPRRVGCHAEARRYIAPDVPGGVAEWLKALAWKACIRETVSWVRIPLPPPVPFLNGSPARLDPRQKARIGLFSAPTSVLPIPISSAEGVLWGFFSPDLCTFGQ